MVLCPVQKLWQEYGLAQCTNPALDVQIQLYNQDSPTIHRGCFQTEEQNWLQLKKLYTGSLLNDHSFINHSKLWQCWTMRFRTNARSYCCCNSPAVMWLAMWPFGSPSAIMQVAKHPWSSFEIFPVGFPRKSMEKCHFGGWNLFNHLFGSQVGFLAHSTYSLGIWSQPSRLILPHMGQIHLPYAAVLCTEWSYLPPFGRELFHSIHLTTTKGRAGIVVVVQGGHVGISLKDCNDLKPIF